LMGDDNDVDELNENKTNDHETKLVPDGFANSTRQDYLLSRSSLNFSPSELITTTSNGKIIANSLHLRLTRATPRNGPSVPG
jgi:hypothetical protein